MSALTDPLDRGRMGRFGWFHRTKTGRFTAGCRACKWMTEPQATVQEARAAFREHEVSVLHQRRVADAVHTWKLVDRIVDAL